MPLAFLQASEQPPLQEFSKRKASDLHPNESARTGCFCTNLALDRFHSTAAGLEDQSFILQEGGEGNKSHFRIVESLLVTLNSFVDTENGSERLNVFCFKLGEHIFSVKI